MEMDRKIGKLSYSRDLGASEKKRFETRRTNITNSSHRNDDIQRLRTFIIYHYIGRCCQSERRYFGRKWILEFLPKKKEIIESPQKRALNILPVTSLRKSRESAQTRF